MSSSAPSCALSAGPELHISAADAQREANVRARVAELTDAKRGARKWVVTADGKGVERVVRFKTFKAAWSFMESVATKCKETRHHPEWTNIYNKTHVVWTTHSPSGLSSKDVTMAEYSDVAAADAGEVEPTEEQRHDDEKLFASKRMEANECCTRKP